MKKLVFFGKIDDLKRTFVMEMVRGLGKCRVGMWYREIAICICANVLEIRFEGVQLQFRMIT